MWSSRRTFPAIGKQIADTGTGGERLKIAYIARDYLPSGVTSTEQLMNNLAALAAVGLEIDLIVPARASEARPVSERRGEIARFYGLRTDMFREARTLLPGTR